MGETQREAHGMSERAWAVYTDQKMHSADAVATVVRIAVAEELRRLAGLYKPQADRERDRSFRLGNTGAPKWQHESYIASAQELTAFVRVLRDRADALDPEGANRAHT
jgi:hypothetical protein